MWVLRVVIVLCVPLMNDASIWGSWGSCTKTCGIGTQIRQRLNSTGDVLESETQYCNTQPCAVEKTCRYNWDCNYGDYGKVKCRNNTCLCTGGEGFNVANCFPQKGTCAILKNPPTSIGYKDPSVKYPRYNRYHLYSCTTNDNPKYEVHVVSLPECFTAECFNKTNTNEISIVPRGPVVKPIILVLTSSSHFTSHSWKIETPVGINKVMFGRFSTVENKSSSKCDFRVFQKLNLKTGDGTDKETSELLRSVYDDYGPITSVTAYRFHRVASVFKIILSVGGNPLQVLPHGYTYKVSSNCTEGMLDCPLMNPQTTAISSSVQTYSWTQWSSCTKTCNIGTQSRCRYNNALQKIEYEEQYCNTQYCPGVDLSCNTTNDCLRQTGWSSAFMNTECKNNVCRCSLEDKYNKHNCFGEVGNCVIRKEPQTALGYKDPSDTYPNLILELLESCTTNDNSVYELHVISIFGFDEIYEVSIKPRGPVSKPIILVLISCSSVHWRLETPVGLYKVLIVGCRYSNTTVEKNSSSKCSFEATQRSDIRHSFLRGDVPDLTKLSIEFGPITSYTRYLKIFSKTTPRIILEVGGSPLQVLTRDYTYKLSSNCTEGMLDCPLMNPQPTAISSGVQTDSWTQWSSCTKTCDIGIQSRCRYNNTNQNIGYEEQYCNTQYCPGVDLSCNTTYDCHRQTRWSLYFKCKNNVCRCSLGDEYNKYNCFGKVGNCVIREEPQTALGYKDPSDAYSNHNQLESCTTNDNSIYELHVISIFGIDEVYEVSVKPRGPVSKPIILVLISYSGSSVHWRLDTPVGLYKVLIGGFRSINKTVEKNSSSKCSFEATQRFDIGYFFFNDYVPDLTKLSNEFGPITSYTRYLEIWSKTTPRIILEVGGSPLQVLTRDYTYDASQLSCESPTPPLAPPPL